MSKSYSIGDVSRITGVSDKQIRNWEKLNYLKGIERIVCGRRAYRRFTQNQLDQIKEIKKYLDAGFTLKAAVANANKIDERGNQK
jgi:DNA-binding transcriptional MerR regulator